MKNDGPSAAKMADAESCPTQNLKSTKIVVTVEEALEDLLVVSFVHGPNSFQGVLLNSNKKSWPLGIVAPTAFPGADGTQPAAEQQTATADGDRLFAVSRRYTYFQDTDKVTAGVGPAATNNNGNRNGACSLLPRRNYCKRFGAAAAGRTMRLRPRQVLCSKCKSICNENSENVEVTANASRREATSNGTTETNNPVTNFVGSNGSAKGSSDPNTGVAVVTGDGGAEGRARMVLRRRRPAENVAPCPPLQATAVKRSRESDFDALLAAGAEERQPVLELQTAPAMDQQQQSQAKTSPFIKISFGPQGTVLKIPPRSHNYSASDNDAAELQEVITPLIDSTTLAIKDASAKAARKALKRAKKEAQRKATVPGASPSQGSPSAMEAYRSRHHKHKFKHKRRHSRGEGPGDLHPLANANCNLLGEHNGVSPGRLQPPSSHQHGRRDAESSENASPETWDCLNQDGQHHDDSYSDIKKECLRQKLSISLKRLSEKSYVKCGSPSETAPTPFDEGDSEGGAPGSGPDGGGGGGGGGDSETNSEAGDGVPAFPENDEPPDNKVRPLTMRISSHHVLACTLPAGEGGANRTMSVGDVVWGKIHGFPWWPGRVLSITVSQRDNGMLVTQQAHVAWFGSSTSSCMPCSQLVPFLECFNTRYNKKKRGPYKEAIKQATMAAQQAVHGVRSVNIEI